MEDENLIKKLENIELPDIEIESHKQRLRMALLNSEHFRKPDFLGLFKKSLAFVFPVLLLLLILGITVIQPKLTEAEALKISKNDPVVQKLMEEKNLALKEVKVKDDKAYVLLNLPEAEPQKGKALSIEIQKAEDEIKNIEGAIIEINLQQKKVAEIKKIEGEEVSPLANQEKEEAKEIVGAEEIIKEIIPSQAKIEKIQASLPRKLLLIEKNQEIGVAPQPMAEKRAQVHYISDGKKWIIQVNLTEKRVEGVQYSPEINDSELEKGDGKIE